jgi:anti-sigma regulatory factor (Ser/Thr protein kinase)
MLLADVDRSAGGGPGGSADGRWTLDLPGRLEEIPRARQLAARIAAELGLDATHRFQLQVALHEAVANAVEHGCRRPEDRVHVHARADGDWLVVDVLDPGGRYEPAPAAMTDPFAPRGRGNLLLAATTDALAVDVAPGCTRLRFRKRLAIGA